MGLPTVKDPSGLNLNTNGNLAQGESNTTTAGVIGELKADRTTNGPKARVKQASVTRSANNVKIRIDAHPQPQPSSYVVVPVSYNPQFSQSAFQEPERGPGYAPGQYRSASRRFKSSTRKSDPEGEESSDEGGDRNMRSANDRPDPRGKLLLPPVPNADPSTAIVAATVTPAPLTESSQQQIREIEDLLSGISTHFESLSSTLGGIEEIERVEELLDQVSTQRESKFKVAVDDGIGGLVKRIQATLSRCDAVGVYDQSRANHGRHLVDDIENTLRGIESSVEESWNIAEKLSDEAEKAATSSPGEAVKIGYNRCYKKKSDNRKPDALAQLPSLKNLIGVVEQTDEHLKRLSSLVVGLDNPKPRRSSHGGRGPDSRAIVIPQELVTTRHAAELIFDMLCRNCPSKDHSAHRLLLGLKTEPAEGEDGDDEVYVQFHLAFESEHCASERLWFRVTSRLTTAENLMEPDNESNIELQWGGGGVAAAPPSPTTPGASYLQPSSSSSFRSRSRSFSASSASPSVAAVEEAATPVRFCISNHKQYANELAISLSNSAHRLFYPSRSYLDLLEKSNLKPLSKRLADMEHPPSTLDKFRWMRLIAEAVLKFHVTQRLSHNLDAENVWFCEFNSTYEIHWHIELLKPLPSSPSSPPPPSAAAAAAAAARETEGGRCYGCSRGDAGIVNIADTLRKLGALFLRIVISPIKEQEQDEALERARIICGKPFSNFLKGCLEGRMGQTSDDFGRVEVQKLFYKQVVQRLRKRENSLLKGSGYGMLSASEAC